MLFLYLPDAISLVVLIIGLTLLRASAIAHCRQELHRLRLDLLLYWTERGLPARHYGYGNVIGQIVAASELIEALTPARLYFARRLFRRSIPGKRPCAPPECLQGMKPEFPSLPDPTASEKLRRVQLEFDLSCGIFFLLGSISGWMVTSGILLKLIRRMWARKPANRTDWAFDFMERVFSHEGRCALRLALLVSHRSIRRPAVAYLR